MLAVTPFARTVTAKILFFIILRLRTFTNYHKSQATINLIIA